MVKISRILTFRVGYLFIIMGLIGVLFINEADAVQTNCSNYTSPIDFNYTLEVRNLSTSGILVSSAICNITIFPLINNSLMLNKGGGQFECPIAVDFPTGRYATNITCNQGNIVALMKGNFEIVPDDVPLSIISYLLGISILFIFYMVKFSDNLAPLKTFLFLLTLLIFFVIFVLVFNIIDEEGAVASLVDFSDIILTVYIYIFLFIVFFVIVRFILNVVNLIRGKRLEEREEG